jgi:hypothetical protein
MCTAWPVAALALVLGAEDVLDVAELAPELAEVFAPTGVWACPLVVLELVQALSARPVTTSAAASTVACLIVEFPLLRKIRAILGSLFV